MITPSPTPTPLSYEAAAAKPRAQAWRIIFGVWIGIVAACLSLSLFSFLIKRDWIEAIFISIGYFVIPLVLITLSLGVGVWIRTRSTYARARHMGWAIVAGYLILGTVIVTLEASKHYHPAFDEIVAYLLIGILAWLCITPLAAAFLLVRPSHLLD